MTSVGTDIFASEEEAEAITLWDVRARAAVYDLATGNNCVSGMVWNDERNELYAATYCQYLGTNGRHIDYAPARIPVERAGAVDDDDSDWEGDEYEDRDQEWPQKANHAETYFGHIFDSGDSRVCEHFDESSVLSSAADVLFLYSPLCVQGESQSSNPSSRWRH